MFRRARAARGADAGTGDVTMPTSAAPRLRDVLVGTAAITAVIMVCNMATGVIAARALGPDGRGELATMMVWGVALLYAGMLGMPEAVGYFTAAEPALRYQTWITAQAVAVALGLAVTGIGWWAIGAFLADGGAASIDATRRFLVWYAVPCLGSTCASTWLQGAGLMRSFDISRLIVPVAYAAGATALLMAGSRSAGHFAAVFLAAILLSWIVSAALAPTAAIIRVPPSAVLARRLLHYGGRVQLGNWANTSIVRLDQLVLSMFVTAEALGVYVVAAAYASALLAIPVSVTLVMLPDVVRAQHEGIAAAAVARWCRRAALAIAAAGAALALVGAYAIPLLFGAPFRGALPLAWLLVPAAIVLGLNQVLVTAFRATGRPEQGSASEILGISVLALALAALLPGYGIYGAAAAALIAALASHLYLAWRACLAFDVDTASLYIPRRDDIRAFRGASVAAVQRFLGASNRVFRTLEL